MSEGSRVDRSDVVWQLRWLMWGGWLVTDGAVLLAAVQFHEDWSWQVFAIGLVVAAVLAIAWLLPFVVYLRRHGELLTSHQNLVVRHRFVVYGTTFMLMGFAMAILAAMFDAIWILWAYTCLCAVMGVFALVLFAVLLRRVRRRFGEW